MKEREVNYKNIQYGMILEIIHDTGGYHTGCKAHFFNHKGVLMGNYYEFMPYEKLRFRRDKQTRNKPQKSKNYPRYFLYEKFEKMKQYFFIKLCHFVTFLIKYTQSHMHKI